MSYGVPLRSLPNTQGAAEALRGALAANVPARHVDFFRRCTLQPRLGDYVFVHAGVRPGMLARQADAGRPDVDPRRFPARPHPAARPGRGAWPYDLRLAAGPRPPHQRRYRRVRQRPADLPGAARRERRFLSTADESRSSSPEDGPHANVSGPERPAVPRFLDLAEGGIPMTRVRFLAGIAALVVAFVTAAAAWRKLRRPVCAAPSPRSTARPSPSPPARARRSTVKLADNWAVALVAPLTMADIKQGSFVGIASLRGRMPTARARGAGVPRGRDAAANEGHYPWDLQPESMMTNATVSTVAAGRRRPDPEARLQGRRTRPSR